MSDKSILSWLLSEESVLTYSVITRYCSPRPPIIYYKSYWNCRRFFFSLSEYHNTRIHDKSCNAKRTKDGYRARPSSSLQENCLENGLTITSKSKAGKCITTGAKLAKLVPRQATKVKRPAPITCRRSTSSEERVDDAFEKRLAELRQKTTSFRKRALKVVFDDKLATVFGAKFEDLDPNMINSAWFGKLVEDLGKEEKIVTYKRELTRAFCFSYFELLRKNSK